MELAQVGKRSRRLSNPKSMSQIEETNHMGSRSAPHDLAKAHNNEKKINHEDKTLTSLESQDKGSAGYQMIQVLVPSSMARS